MTIQTGEKNTNLLPETKWKLNYLKMGQRVYLNHGISKHCIVIGKKIKGIKDPEPLDLQTNFKDWSEKHD